MCNHFIFAMVSNSSRIFIITNGADFYCAGVGNLVSVFAELSQTNDTRVRHSANAWAIASEGKLNANA